MFPSSQHHSFDIALAAQFGVEQAILIHHFQHWIRINCHKGKNFRDGRTWSYQSRVDIQAYFPYLSYAEIRWITEKLVEKGVLITANFNKNPVDKTLWYAFSDEQRFCVDPASVEHYYKNIKGENSKIVYESEKSQSSVKSRSPCVKSHTSIKDIDSLNTDISKEYEEGSPPSAPPPTSAEASSLTDFFISSILKKKPDTKLKATDKWPEVFDKMLRIDNRHPEIITKVIAWLCNDLKQLSYCMSAGKLRERFDELEIRSQESIEKQIVKTNRELLMVAKSKYPDMAKCLTFTDKYVLNVETQKDLLFNLPPAMFEQALKHLMGGE